MFEEFRQQAEEAEYEQNPVQNPEEAELENASGRVPTRLGKPRRILGMTAPQRLFIAVLLLLEVILLGGMFLLVTQKIVPPIFQ